MDYQKIKDNTVTPKIAAYGKAVTLRRPGSAEEYTKSWNAGESRYQWENNTTHAIVYVDPATTPTDVSGHAIEKKYNLKEIAGTTIQITDRRFITSDLPSPTTADKLIVGGVTLNIVSVVPIQPGSVTIVWDIQARA